MITLDFSILCISEEVIIDTKKEKTSYIFLEDLVISHASLEKEVEK
jgi:hypothetical protein